MPRHTPRVWRSATGRGTLRVMSRTSRGVAACPCRVMSPHVTDNAATCRVQCHEQMKQCTSPHNHRRSKSPGGHKPWDLSWDDLTVPATKFDGDEVIPCRGAIVINSKSGKKRQLQPLREQSRVIQHARLVTSACGIPAVDVDSRNVGLHNEATRLYHLHLSDPPPSAPVVSVS